MKIVNLFLKSIFFVLLPTKLLAAEPANGTTPFFMMVKMLSSMAIIVGIIFGGIYLAKKYLPASLGVVSDQRLIKVLSTTYLGNKQKLLLVKAVDKVILIGVSGSEMSVLTKIQASSLDVDKGVPVNKNIADGL